MQVIKYACSIFNLWSQYKSCDFLHPSISMSEQIFARLHFHSISLPPSAFLRLVPMTLIFVKDQSPPASSSVRLLNRSTAYDRADCALWPTNTDQGIGRNVRLRLELETMEIDVSCVCYWTRGLLQIILFGERHWE